MKTYNGNRIIGMHIQRTFLQLVWILFLGVFLASETCGQNTDSPANGDGLLIDALREEMTGNPLKAVEILEKLKHQTSYRSVAYYLLSRIYFADGRKHDALDAIHHSLVDEPNQKWYLQLNSNIAESLGLYLEAAQCNLSLSKIEPYHYAFYDNAAFHFVNAQEYENALQVLDAAQKNIGTKPEIILKKAFILGEQQKYRKGIELIEQALPQYPNNTEFRDLIIRLTTQSNDTKLQQSIKQKYPQWFAPVNSENATNDRLDSLVSNPDSDPEEFIKEAIHRITHLNENDSATFQQLLLATKVFYSKYPKNIKLLCLLADIHYINDQLVEASKLYQRAIRESNVPFSVWENALASLVALGYWSTVVEQANKCLDYFPNQSYPYFALSTAWIHLGKYQEAQAPLEQLEVMHKNRKTQLAQVLLLKAKMLDGLHQNSQSAWEMAMRHDSTHWMALERVVSGCQHGNAGTFSLDENSMNSFMHSSFHGNVLMAQYWLCKSNVANAKQCIDFALSMKDFKNAAFYALASDVYKKSGFLEEAKTFEKLGSQVGELSKTP